MRLEYIGFNLMQLTKQQSRVLPRRGHQQDKYQGQLHPTSKVRHGIGHYQYDNAFFSYDGQYNQGKKQGQGTLTLRDGTTITGTFEQDQLIGPAEIKYSHGALYMGNLLMGEKDGRGRLDSVYEFYDGQWKDNNKHGRGVYRNKSTQEEYSGEFKGNKYHGKGKLSCWNYCYEGEFQEGKKQGHGKETNDWPRENEQGKGKYEYSGSFKQDQFEGEGEYKSRESKYIYTGSFLKGIPTLYPNEFRIFVSTNNKTGEEIVQTQKALIGPTQSIEYQLEGDSLNFYIETVYQGPEVLDQIQPTQEEIDTMIKNWQNENKKNKNPPPMPDFTQPRMKKPQLLKVTQQSGRTITLKLLKQVEGNYHQFKIDYQAQMSAKRKQNENLKLEALKKAEQDAGKKGGKKDNKEPELKVNLFKEKPTKRETLLHIYSAVGSSELKSFELPDDFPIGKYILEISSQLSDFGRMQTLRKQMNVKTKVAAKKK